MDRICATLTYAVQLVLQCGLAFCKLARGWKHFRSPPPTLPCTWETRRSGRPYHWDCRPSTPLGRLCSGTTWRQPIPSNGVVHLVLPWPCHQLKRYKRTTTMESDGLSRFSKLASPC